MKEARMTLWVPTYISEHAAAEDEAEDHQCECCGNGRSNIKSGQRYFLISFYRRYLRVRKPKGDVPRNILPFVPDYVDPEKKMNQAQIKYYIEVTINLRICSACLAKIDIFFDINLLSGKVIDQEKLRFRLRSDLIRSGNKVVCGCCQRRLKWQTKYHLKNNKDVICDKCIEPLRIILAFHR
jgi:hypothetical protein